MAIMDCNLVFTETEKALNSRVLSQYWCLPPALIFY